MDHHAKRIIYQLPLISCFVACCLINFVYLTACAFIRSDDDTSFKWRWINTKIENCITVASLKSETMGKLIEYQARVLWYQVYQARLRERMLNRSASSGKLDIKRHPPSILYISASLAMSTSVLEALPGKLDIKRHVPCILYIGYYI